MTLASVLTNTVSKDCKLLYVLNKIVHLPDGAIPAAAEATHAFRATARRLAANLGGLENKDGEREEY